MLIPVMQSLFKLAALNALQWWMVLACSVGALSLNIYSTYLARDPFSYNEGGSCYFYVGASLL